MLHQNNDHDEDSAAHGAAKPKRKGFGWLRAFGSREQVPTLASAKQDKKHAGPPLPSPSAFHKKSSAPAHTEYLSTPPLSESTSSAASSSIDTVEDSASFGAPTSVGAESPPLPAQALPDALEKAASANLNIKSVNPSQSSPQRPDFPIQEPLSASLASTHTVQPRPQSVDRPRSLAASPIYDSMRSSRADSGASSRSITPSQPVERPAAASKPQSAQPETETAKKEKKQSRISLAFMKTKRADVEKALPSRASNAFRERGLMESRSSAPGKAARCPSQQAAAGHGARADRVSKRIRAVFADAGPVALAT
jgi:hypothetical protein